MSKLLQVYLDERDLARLERWSRERGWTKSKVVRAALRALTTARVRPVARSERHDRWLATGPVILLSARAPAGLDWHPTSKGFRYRSRTLTPDGLQSATLQAGAAGRAKATVKGKGNLLPLPGSASPLPLPLLVQLQGDHGSCWEARFETATANDGITFKSTGE